MSDQPVYDVLKEAADRLRDLNVAALPSPWSVEASRTANDVPLLAADGRYLCASPDDGVRGGHWAGDAALIVALRPVAEPLAEWLDDQAEKCRMLHRGRWADDPFAMRFAYAALGRPAPELTR